MMLYVYTGVPGSGKSLHAANDVRFALNHGRPVIANFELGADAPVKDRSLYHYVSNDQLSVSYITEFCDAYWADPEHKFREDFVLLVLDEVQILWNSRRWSEKGRMEWLELWSQSRKYGLKVIMIAQSAKMIDNQFRQLVDTEINHRKVSSFGTLGFLISLPFRDRLFLRVSSLFQSGIRLGSEWSIGSKKDMQMYDSYVKLRRQEVGNTLKTSAT